MVKSFRALEGEVVIDHRNSPGISKQDIAAVGLDPSRFPDLRGGTLYEAPTISCTHCQRIVVLNPLRTRPRNYCGHCDHYICDNPNCILMASGQVPHQPLRQVMDHLAESVLVSSNFSEL